MGRKGGKKWSNARVAAQPHSSLTLREESSRKKQVHVNAKTMCKFDHLKNLAAWASTEASIPSVGAFFGERLAATTEALGIRSDPSLFVCERCEAILQPGHNCTVRIEKNKPKTRRRRKKSDLTTQNTVVYTCHFCSHRNLMRGSPKGYMKEICPPKAKPPPKLQPTNSAAEKHANSMTSASEKHASSTKSTATIPTFSSLDMAAVSTTDAQNVEASIPAPPLTTIPNVSLLDLKRKKRTRSAAKKQAEPEPTPETTSTATDAGTSVTSSKRRKKAWMSLKDIARSSEHDTSKKQLTKLTIPHSLFSIRLVKPLFTRIESFLGENNNWAHLSLNPKKLVFERF